MEIVSLVVLLFIAMFFSASFSGLEMAYVSFDKLLLKKEATGKEGKYLGRMNKMLKHPPELITLMLIGNNFCLICLSSAATLLAQRLLTGQSEQFIEFFVIATLTPLIIIFGELLPKHYGLVLSTRLCQLTNYLVFFLYRLFMPFIVFVLGFAKVLLMPFRSRLEHDQEMVTREELKRIFEEGFRQGEMNYVGKQMVKNVLELNQSRLKDKMVPIANVAKININESVEKLKELSRKKGFARYLVYGKSPKDIMGFISVYDVLFDDRQKVTIRDHLRTPLFLHENMTLQNAVENLKREEERFLCVIDQKDQVIGCSTLKRILDFRKQI